MRIFFVILTILGVNTLAAFAQGQINANNASLTGIYLTVSDPGIDNNATVRVGTLALGAGFSSSVGPGQVTVKMYAAPNGTPLAILQSLPPIATALNTSSTLLVAQGSFSVGGALELTTSAASITISGTIVPGWNGSQPLEIIFYATSSDGVYTGWSGEATDVVVATGVNLPTFIFGTADGQINSFNLTNPVKINPVPEPSALALLGFGILTTLSIRKK